MDQPVLQEAPEASILYPLPEARQESGTPGWVDALGWMKKAEMQRRVGFREFSDRVGAVLAEERYRAGSAQQLVAAVRVQIGDRAEADMESARRLQKLANQREAEFSKSKSGEWTAADKADVAYLTEMLRRCAQIVEDAARAFKSALEGSNTFQKWEVLDKSTSCEVAAVEHALKSAAACDTKRVKLWEKHEAACRKKLSFSMSASQEAGAAVSIKIGDVWASETEYRQCATQFDREVATCICMVSNMQRELQGHATEHRTLAKQMLADFTKCVATGYKQVAEALAPSGFDMLPSFPKCKFSTSSSTPAETEPVAAPQFPELPASLLVLHQGPVERSPKSMFSLRSWEPAHLLVTVDGFVHCFGGPGDVGVKSPSWSMAPKPGSFLAIDRAASKMMFSPPGGWAPQAFSRRKIKTIKVSQAEQLEEWEKVVSRWWPPPSSNQTAAVSGSASDELDCAQPSCDEDDDGATDTQEALETAAETQDSIQAASLAASAMEAMATSENEGTFQAAPAEEGPAGAECSASGLAAEKSVAAPSAAAACADAAGTLSAGALSTDVPNAVSMDTPQSATAGASSSLPTDRPHGAEEQDEFEPPPRVPTDPSPEDAI